MDAADGSRRVTPKTGVRLGYGVASLVLLALHPFLPDAWGDADLVVAVLGAAACVVTGRRAAPRGGRLPWTLLLWSLALLVVANVVQLAPYDRGVAIGLLMDSAANLLVLAAALSLIMRHGTSDLGAVIDAAVIAFAAGSLVWVVLPHRLGQDQSLPAQLNLFVVVFALTGVLGALLRLTHTAVESSPALRWLLVGISLAIGGNVLLSVAGSDPALTDGATLAFIGAFTAIGMFGLDPTGPRLAYPQAASRERLTVGRLAFLGAAVALIPVVIGTRDLLAGEAGGLLLAIQGTLVAAIVMARTGLLSAQRAQAEQTLEHQATHDPLTHLPNRREFVSRLRDELGRGARCVLLFCDLDDFKSINDRFGHDAGDQLLIEVTQRLLACAGSSQLVSRIGGDEFVVLLIDATPSDGEAVRDCIVTALRRPFEPAGGVGVRVSVGLAYADDERRDPEQLIRAADHAMYRAKASQKSDPRVTRPSGSSIAAPAGGV